MPHLSRRALVGLAALAPLLTAGAALAHHGWAWTAPEDFTLTGRIEEIHLGNPHARLMVAAQDGLWTVDLAPPSRTAASGFVEGVAEVGDEVTAQGHRSRDPQERRMKAERITIDGRDYDVYPNRAGSS